ncbi:MAG: S1 RNA-binding domain-containing protein, partial [Rikenellaceae bacterium]|nr:S1 RNA-binding domain-containing protein [Rikenellaceae bacterium]
LRNFTNFGVFVEIEEGVDGLIHISDLSWTKKIKHPAEFTSKGAEIEVVVLEIDKENRRLSLGHKQLEDNPWDVFETLFTLDSTHKGTIAEINDKGAIVTLEHGVEGFAPTKQLVKEDGTMPVVGETLDFKVIEFVKATKRITLSHTRIAQGDNAPALESSSEKPSKDGNSTQKAVKMINSAVEKTTLGDISGLAELKAQLENAEK